MGAINALKSNVPNYTVPYNCTSAALSIAKAAGLDLPNGIGRATVDTYGIVGVSIANPYTLNGQMLQRFGQPTVVHTSRNP